MLSSRIAATAPFHVGTSFSPIFLPLKKLFVESCISVLGLSLCICKVALFQNQSCSISETSEKICSLWSTEFMLEIHTQGSKMCIFLSLHHLLLKSLVLAMLVLCPNSTDTTFCEHHQIDLSLRVKQEINAEMLVGTH